MTAAECPRRPARSWVMSDTTPSRTPNTPGYWWRKLLGVCIPARVHYLLPGCSSPDDLVVENAGARSGWSSIAEFEWAGPCLMHSSFSGRGPLGAAVLARLDNPESPLADLPRETP